ncbi:hypothetical protein AB0I22_33065 [Streptomyces sp. NPDC050610]|uniref:hypothetical protein n=1 Tax=Streptomyces sp. NPDC050610 TaxID=3157097 RepID=UPI003437989B
MDSDLRRAAVAALSELGRSRDYRDRADAGRGLAGLAEMPEAVGLLIELVLDPDDTFVTRVTAEAVLRRRDRTGLAIVASALADADPNHLDWIHAAVADAVGILSSDRDHALQVAEELAADGDDHISRGAHQLLDMLAELNPVLRPASVNNARDQYT